MNTQATPGKRFMACLDSVFRVAGAVDEPTKPQTHPTAAKPVSSGAFGLDNFQAHASDGPLRLLSFMPGKFK